MGLRIVILIFALSFAALAQPVSGPVTATSNSVPTFTDNKHLRDNPALKFDGTNLTVNGVAVLTNAQPASANLTNWSALATSAKQDTLGYTPLNVASNLSDVANAATARGNIGAGTGNGSVTSIGLTGDSDFQFGAAMTTSGTIAISQTNSTGTGAYVRQTSPTLTTPTIASFANANHNHQDSAGGGLLSESAISGLTAALLAKQPASDNLTNWSAIATTTKVSTNGTGFPALTGDVTTVQGAVATTLKATGTAGTYRSVTFDAQGRETSGSNPTTFSGYGLSDTSENLAAALTDESGTGVFVLSTNATLVSPTISGASLSGPVTNMSTIVSAVPIELDAIGSTVTEGLILTNKTAAAAGAQQVPPALRFDGFGWATSGSSNQPVSWRIVAQPVQGSANPTVNLLLQSSVNGSTYSTRATFANSGSTLTLAGAVVSQSGASSFTSLSASTTFAVTGASTLSGAVTVNSIVSTNGLSSTNTTAAVNGAATGWTNTFGKNATVYVDGVTVTFTVKNGAGTAMWTNATAFTGRIPVPLQSGGAVVTSGTGVTTRGVVF